MTDEEIDAQLATLGLDRRWVDLGVLTEEWLAPTGKWRMILRDSENSPEDMLEQALFNYLTDRTSLDDATISELLDVAARAGEACSRQLADWNRLTVEQLAQVARHDGSSRGTRRLAAQKLRVYALETGEDVAVNLVGFGDGDAGTLRRLAARVLGMGVFKIGRLLHPPAFRFGIAWERRLNADEGRRIGVLLAAIPEEEGARCHMPAFGLRLDAGTSDETRMSICFQCNNIYLHGGGKRTFAALSPEGRALLAYLIELAPAEWSRRIGLLGA